MSDDLTYVCICMLSSKFVFLRLTKLNENEV